MKKLVIFALLLSLLVVPGLASQAKDSTETSNNPEVTNHGDGEYVSDFDENFNNAQVFNYVDGELVSKEDVVDICISSTGQKPSFDLKNNTNNYPPQGARPG